MFQRLLIIFTAVILSAFAVQAQTNPTAQTLPFSFTSQSGSTLPAGMAVHVFAASPTSPILTPGTGDMAYNAGATSGGWRDEAANGIAMLGSSSVNAGAFVVAVDTTGLTNVQVSWIARTITQQASRDNSLTLQYRVGTTGNFTDVDQANTTYSTTGQSAGHSASFGPFTLPVAAENQSVVQLRWIYWQNNALTGSRDRIALDDIGISGSAGSPTNTPAGDTPTPTNTPEPTNTPTATNTPPTSTTVIINEVDSDTPGGDVAEFIELYDGGIGNTSLDGHVVVLYNGSTDVSYLAVDLDGYSTNAQGYFVIGSTGMGTPIELPPGSGGWIQNGQDAVALYLANGSDFPNGTAVTLTNLVDALVYDTSDADDPGLLVLLNTSEPQIDENMNAHSDIESMQRCPNGTGGARNTSTYALLAPTMGVANTCIFPTDTPTETPVPTDTPLPTDTPTEPPVPTDTPTETPVATDTPLPTDTPTEPPVPTDTPTEPPVNTNTPTATPTRTPTPTPTIRPGDTCANAIVLAYPTCVTGSTVSYANNYDCNTGSSVANSSDVVYTFTLPEPMTVSIVAEASYDADFGLSNICDASTSNIVACADTYGAQANPSCSSLTHNSYGYFTFNQFIPAGTYYFWVDGYSGNTGNYALELIATSGPTATPTTPPTATPTRTPTATATPVFGGSCAMPFVVNADTDLPYTSSETTCGKGNTYSNTCLGNYDGGEDAIYQLTLTSEMYIEISYTTALTYTGILLDDSCPPDPTTCIDSFTISGAGGGTLGGNLLPAGTYYIMLDTWPTPNCFAYTLTITGAAQTPTPTITPTPFPGENCSNPVAINCGDCVTGSTVGRANDHTCSPGHAGPDLVYELTLATTQMVHFLGEADYDADWSIATTCAATADILCVDYYPIDTGDLTLSCGTVTAEDYSMLDFQTVLLPGVYYIWIDGWTAGVGGNFALEVTCSTPSTVHGCPTDAIFGQEARTGDDAQWSASVSDLGTTNRVADNFSGLTTDICDIHWYGLNAYNGGSGFATCSKPDPETFTVVFYEDNAGVPGTVAGTYTVSPTKVATGDSYGLFPLYYYSTTISPCLTLTDGWVSIQSDATTGCWFLWANSYDGEYAAASSTDSGTTWTAAAENFAFCLTDTVEPTATPTPEPTNTPEPTVTPTETPSEPTPTPTATIPLQVPASTPMGIGLMIAVLSALIVLNTLARKR